MSHIMTEIPCPGCGNALTAWDIRGKRHIWKPLNHSAYVYGCAKCKRYWKDNELIHEGEWPGDGDV